MLDHLMGDWRRSKTIWSLDKTYRYLKDKNNVNYLDKKQRKEVIQQFFLFLQDYLISGGVYKPPFGFGEFKVHKFKATKPRRNYRLEKEHFKNNEQWKKINFQNFHTDGQVACVKWFTTDYHTIPGRRVYRFLPNRKFHRKLASKLKTEGTIDNYLNSTRKTRISRSKTLI